MSELSSDLVIYQSGMTINAVEKKTWPLAKA